MGLWNKDNQSCSVLPFRSMCRILQMCPVTKPLLIYTQLAKVTWIMVLRNLAKSRCYSLWPCLQKRSNNMWN